MNLQKFQSLAGVHLGGILILIQDSMKDTGDTEEASQKITLLNRLKELEYAFNGVEQGDLNEDKGGKITGLLDKNGFDIRLGHRVRRTGTLESYSKPRDTFLVYESNNVVYVDGIELRHYAPEGSLYTTLEVC